jgi:hypothetical protein
MKFTFSMFLFVFVFSALVPATQVDHQKEKPNANKPHKPEASKPQSAVPSDGETNQIKTHPQEANGEEGGQERAYRVEVISQPSDWTGDAAVLIALLSMVFVWQQVRTMKNSERAWIMGSPEFNNFTKPPDPGEYVLYPASFKNFGRTPAKVIEAGISLKTIKSLKNMPPTPVYVTGEVLPLGNLLVPEDSFALAALPLVISKQEYWEIMNRELFLYAHGFVKYRDVFGKKRETRFCHYYLVPFPGGLVVEGFGTYTEAPSKYSKAT